MAMDQSQAAQGVGVALFILIVFVYPALCVSRIAAKLGKSATRYGLCSLIPLGVLVALGVLAFSAPASAARQR